MLEIPLKSLDHLTGEEGLKPLLKRTFRKRREKARDQIVSKAPMGIECTAQELQEEEFPKFEMIDLSFKLDNLNSLSSSQLAVSSYFLFDTCSQLKALLLSVGYRRSP